MASLLLACGLNEQKLVPYIHLSEESGVDGGFLISAILGQRLRIPNSGIIFVCLQQTYHHYLQAGMRLGYNLNMFKDKNLCVLEPINDIAVDFPNSNWTNSSPDSPNGNVNDADLTGNLFKSIEKEIKETFKDKMSVTLMVDNLSILHNMGASYNSVVKFCKNLEKLTNDLKDKNHLTIVTKLSNCETFEILDNCLITLSDLHVRIVKLKSGSFKEVDGRLIVSKEELDGLYGVSKSEKNILYKVNDRNIKTFNPGEVGVKI